MTYATTLDGAISASQTEIYVDDLPDEPVPDFITIGSETMALGWVQDDFSTAADPTQRIRLGVTRGALGTARATHSGALGTARATHSDAAAVSAYNSGPIVGSPASIYYSEIDPGAVGAGGIWIRLDTNYGIQSLAIRDVTNDGWSVPAMAMYGSDNDNPTPTAFVGVDGGGVHLYTQGIDESLGGNVDVNSSGPITLVNNTDSDSGAVTVVHPAVAALGAELLNGSADPSGGAGTEAVIGSMYMRNTGSAGELWLKTGSGDHDWAKVTTA